MSGTHMGRLSPEARERRAAKNAHWRSRSHPTSRVHDLDMPVAGSNKRIHTRLATKGNREHRGLGR